MHRSAAKARGAERPGRAVRRSAAKPCGAERPGRAVHRSAAKSCGAERPGRCAPLRCQTTRGREAWARCAPLRCLTTKGAPAPASEAAPPSAVAPISVAPSRGLLNGELGGAAGEPSSAPASGAPAGAAASNSLASMNGRAEPRDAARDAPGSWRASLPCSGAQAASGRPGRIERAMETPTHTRARAARWWRRGADPQPPAHPTSPAASLPGSCCPESPPRGRRGSRRRWPRRWAAGCHVPRPPHRRRRRHPWPPRLLTTPTRSQPLAEPPVEKRPRSCRLRRLHGWCHPLVSPPAATGRRGAVS